MGKRRDRLWSLGGITGRLRRGTHVRGGRGLYLRRSAAWAGGLRGNGRNAARNRRPAYRRSIHACTGEPGLGHRQGARRRDAGRRRADGEQSRGSRRRRDGVPLLSARRAVFRPGPGIHGDEQPRCRRHGGQRPVLRHGRDPRGSREDRRDRKHARPGRNLRRPGRSRARARIAARSRQGRAGTRSGGRAHSRRVQRHRAGDSMRQRQGGPQAGRSRFPLRHFHEGFIAAAGCGGEGSCRQLGEGYPGQANLAERLYVTASANRQQYRDEVGELIANYVVNVSDKLDARAERAAKAALIASIAVAIAALRHPAAQNARKHAYRFPANSKSCVIWGTQKRAAPELAAFTNGVLLRCHDYNDFFVGRRNSGHSSDILSSVIAAAEWTDAPGKKLLSAVAIGYEMVGAAFDAFSTAPGGWDYTNLSALGATAAIE